MTIQKLEELLSHGESEKLDYKLELKLELESHKKEFAKDVCAIANSKGGRGYIIFGIEDKTKKVVGVTTKVYEEERVQQLVSSRLDPPVPVRLEEIIYQGKKIVILIIFKSEQLPHQIIQTGTFYIRRGSTSDVARRHELAAMLQENGLVSWERILQRNATLDDLDWGLLQRLIAKNIRRKSESSLLMLDALGIIGRETGSSFFYPTMGGILLFGKKPQNFFPTMGVCIESDGKTTLLEGNIPSILEQTERMFSILFMNKSYPVKAVYEAIYNAIVHRDYWDFSREIYVFIDSKNIEIVNPGAIWQGEGLVRFSSEMNPPRRNPWLYQRLLLWDKRQRLLNNPYGIRVLRSSFENGEDVVKFINLPRKNLFKVVLPGTEY